MWFCLFSWGLQNQVMPSAAPDKACTGHSVQPDVHVVTAPGVMIIVYTGTPSLLPVGWLQPHSEWSRRSGVAQVSMLPWIPPPTVDNGHCMVLEYMMQAYL